MSTGKRAPWAWAGVLAAILGALAVVYVRTSPAEQGLMPTSASFSPAKTTSEPSALRAPADDAAARSLGKPPTPSAAPPDDPTTPGGSLEIDDLRALVMKAPDAGERELRAYLAAHPKDPRAHALQAMMLMKDEDFTGARRAALACLRAAPGDEMCERLRIFSYSRDGEMARRLPIMDACLSAKRSTPRCLDAMLQAHIDREELEDARGLLREIDALDPTDAYDEVARGRLAASQGKDDEALLHFRKACEARNDDGCDRAEDLDPAP